METIRQSSNIGDDGYLNVASQFGLSTQRGMSPPLYPHPIPSIHLALANTHDPQQTIPCTRLSQLPDHRITLGRDSMLVIIIITSLSGPRTRLGGLLIPAALGSIFEYQERRMGTIKFALSPKANGGLMMVMIFY